MDISFPGEHLTLPLELSELEQAFRQSWHGFAPHRYTDFLDRVSLDHRLELPPRILSAELEFAYAPPVSQPNQHDGFECESAARNQIADRATTLHPNAAGGEDEDQRVIPCVPLFLLRYRRDTWKCQQRLQEPAFAMYA